MNEENNEKHTGSHQHHYVHMVLCIVMIGAAFYYSSRGEKDIPKPEPAAAVQNVFEEQWAEAGGITVSAQPKQTERGMEFNAVFDTHSGELDFDPKSAVVLRDMNGKEAMPREWTGDPSGGHHRKVTVSFDAVLDEPFTLIVKDVGGIPERLFTWKKSP